jgi:FKBP-type peptidyl-prolyl cis-trans isomerase FklB
MTKILTTAVILLAAGTTLAASGLAQQTDAAKPATASPSTSTTHKAVTSNKAAAAKSPSGELKTQKEKASYAIGMNIASGLKRDGIDVDPAAISRGLKDALAGDKSLMTEDEAKAALMTLEKEVKTKQEAKMKSVGEENKKAGEAFLAANKSKEGVITLADGLQYKVEKQGDGAKPSASDTVQCNYRGTLISGKEFDSSYKRGTPASFAVTGVIPGWTEVLQLMPVGSKYQVFVPSELAYKERAAGPDIGPNATLIFEIELLAVNPTAAKSTEPAK